MKKYFYTLTIIIAIAMGSYVLIRANKNISPAEFVGTDAVATSTPPVQAEDTTISTSPTPVSGQQVRTEATTIAATNAPKEVPAPNVTLSVAGSSYAVFAPAGSTVIDTMRVLASTNDFSFSGKDYPSLGFFVDSINGKTAESGYSWILYVNGKLSGTGASQTTLKAGDAIEWRYEASY